MSKDKSAKLDIEFFDKYYEAAQKASELREVIEDRITYIIKTICKTFNCKFDTWYVYGAAEGEVGNIDGALEDDFVHLIIESELDDDCAILTIDSREYSLRYGFPRIWLFQDFEEELINGKDLYIKKKEAEKEKKKLKLQAKQIKKNETLEQIKSKLSKQELKALGVK